MRGYSIVDAEAWHVRPVAAALGDADREAMRMAHLDPLAALGALFDVSCHRRSALLGEQPVAIWGLLGTMMSDDGEVWVALTNAARAFPSSVARVARREIHDMLGTRRQLRASIMCGHADGFRFARFLGFEIGPRRSAPIDHFEAVVSR